MNEESAEWQACREFYAAILDDLRNTPHPYVRKEFLHAYRFGLKVAWQLISPEYKRQLTAYLERMRAEREAKGAQ